jgi:phenylacetate-coenzyme A ligase PaaK-like adenylate-forming protein
MGKKSVHIHTLLSLCRLMHGYPFHKEKIKILQLKKLKKLLVHAYEDFEFYRERMDSCRFNPYKVKNLRDLEFLPVLSKEEYRSFTNDLLNKNPDRYKNWYMDMTSGSTGIPLKIVRSWPERGYMMAKWMRELYLNGYRCTDKSFRTVVPSRLNSKNEIFLQNLGLFRRTRISYSLSEKEMVEAYQLSQPDFFYSSQVEAVLIAKYILEHNIKINQPKIYSVGGAMVDKNSRELLNKVFGEDNFFETYGCEETGILGFQIKGEKGLNFSHDTNILELLAPDGSIATDEGSCLITDLGIYSFPLIRYQLGDNLKTFTDENGIQKIDKIQGRLDDWLIWEDGSKSGMGYFYEIMSKYSSGISQFRIIQENHKHIRIMVALSPLHESSMESPQVIKEEIIGKLKKNLRADIEYQVEFVDMIPPDKNGKLRIIVSKVDQGE